MYVYNIIIVEGKISRCYNNDYNLILPTGEKKLKTYKLHKFNIFIVHFDYK